MHCQAKDTDARKDILVAPFHCSVSATVLNGTQTNWH